MKSKNSQVKLKLYLAVFLFIIITAALIASLLLGLLKYRQQNADLFVNQQSVKLIVKNEADPIIKDDSSIISVIHLLEPSSIKPSIMILVANIGLSLSSTNEALNLPKEILIGISPYANNIDDLIKKAQALNHEILINLPLEPRNYPIDDPGPYALLSKLSIDDNINKLQAINSKGSMGYYSLGDEKFYNNKDSITSVLLKMKELKANYLFGGSKENIMIDQLAKELNFPLIRDDCLIDQNIAEFSIKENLIKLEMQAKKHKVAIGIIRPYPITIKLLNNWISSLTSKQIELINLKQYLLLKNSIDHE